MYSLLQYYLNQTSLKLENCKSGIQSKTQVTLYQQVTIKDHEQLLLNMLP